STFLLWTEPNELNPLVGNMTSDFVYGFNGGLLHQGRSILSTTTNMTTIISKNEFELSTDGFLVFEAGLTADSFLEQPSYKQPDTSSDYFYGTPMFGIISTTDQ